MSVIPFLPEEVRTLQLAATHLTGVRWPVFAALYVANAQAFAHSGGQTADPQEERGAYESVLGVPGADEEICAAEALRRVHLLTTNVTAQDGTCFLGSDAEVQRRELVGALVRLVLDQERGWVRVASFAYIRVEDQAGHSRGELDVSTTFVLSSDEVAGPDARTYHESEEGQLLADAWALHDRLSAGGTCALPPPLPQEGNDDGRGVY